ncbi:MAG TPA: DUF1707 domain-containing protein [Streptosporangiaceae bacterium]|nr:DUF1707 domain-containing protein [Streptosporangiaceae bacterium]
MPGTSPPGPRPVLSEAGREKLLSLLREHHAQGNLDLAEMSRRVGVVLAAAYSDEAAAAVTDLALLAGTASGSPPAAQPSRGRIGQRRRHAQQMQPDAAWVPTPERFRDPSTRAIVRVWIDPADLSRHYVPEPGG